MRDGVDFYEIRQGKPDDFESVCLVKDEEDAEKLMKLLATVIPDELFIVHIEFVADIYLREAIY